MAKHWAGTRPKPASSVPDAKFIRQRLPIGEVLQKLGIKGNGRYYYCWRDDHGRPTVGVHLPSNTTRCFRCDTRGLSPVDLVIAVLGIDVGSAFRWFATEFPDVPRRRVEMRGRKVRSRTEVFRHYTRAHWPEVSCGALVLSKPWASFRSPEKLLAVAIMAHMPTRRKEHPVISTNYWELMAWAGIGDRQVLARALRTLRQRGLIETALVPTGNETPAGFQTRRTLIRLTWFSTAWQTALGRADTWCPNGQSPRCSVKTFDGSHAAAVPLRHAAAPAKRTATSTTVREVVLRSDTGLGADLRHWDAKGVRLQ